MKTKEAQQPVESWLELGRRLRGLRAKAGVTRKQLAAMSDTSERYLAHLEAGTGNPSLGILTALAGALDVAVAELLPLGGERNELHERAAAGMRRLTGDRLSAVMQWIDSSGAQSGKKGGRVVLIGMRGAGKTSLGQAVAERLGAPFVEMSKEVEAAYGDNIGLLIELGGQSALRRYEREAWESLCARHGRAVIAASGGVVADGPLYERVLESAHSIWLEAAPDDHMGRVMAQGDFRPMANGRGAMADLKAILAARASDYARADFRLDTSGQDFDATVARLEQLCRPIIAEDAI